MKSYRITVNGNVYDITVEELAPGQIPSPAPVAVVAPVAVAQAPTAPSAPAAPQESAQAPAAVGGSAGSEKVTSPLPGTVLRYSVKVGDKVKRGQSVAIVEAMKMENEIPAPVDGTISSINVSEGTIVNAGDLLMTLN